MELPHVLRSSRPDARCRVVCSRVFASGTSREAASEPLRKS